MQTKLQKAIGVVKDHTSISLAIVSSNSSSNLEVSVLRATTHDDVPVDEKYIYEVLQYVSSNKLQAAACARAIGKRIGRTRNWVVALKSLILVLRIFQDGDPYFPREVLHAMKRGARILNLSSFRDDSNSSPWDFTAFVRTFSLYLDERLECFLTGKLQRRFTNGKRETSTNLRKSRGLRRLTETVRDMKPTMLLDKISYWQRLLERAIATRPTGLAKTNHLVQISFYAIVQESFELYKDISDGLALLLDSFFHLQYQNCVTAFQTCVKAVKQFEELSAFYALCKSIGVGRRSEYPSMMTISDELIETLQEFLKDQTSIPSNAKPINRAMLLPAPLSTSRSTTTDGNSKFRSHCTSLEDLISATETGMTIPPAISIDLEAYPSSQRNDSFRISDTGSTRSLPVSNSMADLMSLDDWSAHNEKKHRQEHEQKWCLDSQASKNWELDLAETISTISTPTTSSQTLSIILSNSSDAFSNQTTSTPIASSQTLSNNMSSSFDTFSNQPPTTTDENPYNLATNNPINIWEVVLFEAASPYPSVHQHVIPYTGILPNNHYNPFLQEESPPISNGQFSMASPTFQAVPTFSAHEPIQNDNDSFACAAVFSGEQLLSSSIDQQNLLQEQQLWLQNQNKITGKHRV